MTAVPAYAELQATSNFTFLRGASHPQELAVAAAALGLAGFALTDRNSLAGVVRAHMAAKVAEVRFIVGARLDFRCGRSLLVYPTDRAAYGRLARLITLGRRRAGANAISTSPISILSARADHDRPARGGGGATRGFVGGSGHPLPRPRLSRRPASLSWRRPVAPRPAGGPGSAGQHAAGRRQRCPCPCPRAPSAAGCPDLHPRALHHRGGGLSPLRQCRAAYEITGGDGPALRRSSRGAGPDGGDRRALPLLPRRAALRISR